MKDITGTWLLRSLWSNGELSYPPDHVWDFSDDGLVALTLGHETTEVKHGQYTLSSLGDSIRVDVMGMEVIEGGVRLIGDTLHLTSYDGYGAHRLRLERMSFMTSDSAYWHLRFELDKYTYSQDGSTVHVSGMIVNDSKHNYRDVDCELQISRLPHDRWGSVEPATIYEVRLPLVLGGARSPFTQSLQVPEFVTRRGQELFGWDLVPRTKLND